MSAIKLVDVERLGPYSLRYLGYSRAANPREYTDVVTCPQKSRFFPNEFFVLLLTVLVASPGFAQASKAADQHVNAKAAVEIAEEGLVRVYGKAVTSERPFTAKLKNGAWAVVGTQQCQELLPAPGFYCPEGHWAIISKDGRILSMGKSNGHVRQ
jgi:NTF2 fold immunity protein of polymorphic toxin system component